MRWIMKRPVFGIVMLVASLSTDGMNDISQKSSLLNFRTSKDLSYFRSNDGNQKTKVVALYRGINFCSDVFSPKEKMNHTKWKKYINSYTPGVSMLESFHTQRTFQKLSKFLKNTPQKISREEIRRHQVLNLNFQFQYILRANKKKIT